MGTCGHRYGHERDACPHAAPEGADRCLWHNPRVRKADDYLPEVLAAADAASSGDLEGFHLVGLQWPRARLGGRQLRDADLRDAALDRGDLQLADLRRVNLRRAGLRDADLRGANLSEADLTGANLTGADLRGANLTGAKLAGAAVNGADLRGATLVGADLGGLQWNRRTRFAGITGLERPPHPGSEDTEASSAPVASGEDESSASGVPALEEPDPSAAQTHVWTTARTSGAPGAKRGPRDPSPGRRIALAAAAAAVVVAAYVAGRVSDPPAASTAPVAVDGSAAGAAQERPAADAAALRDLLAGARGSADDAIAEAVRIRGEMREMRAESERLGAADDRAAILALELAEQRDLAERLAQSAARQEQAGGILAESVTRVEGERDAARRELVDARERAARGDRAEAEAERLTAELAAVDRERDGLRVQGERLTGELIAARDDLERYLRRAHGSGLDALLVDDAGDAALVAVVPDEPIALGGDYQVTVRIGKGEEPDTIRARLSVQRPPALANPDVAVVLYDRDKRPLRRMSFGFPAVDSRTPFASATVTVGCERFPAYARVVLAPGAEPVAAAAGR